MEILDIISKGYREYSGRTETKIVPLPRSGSDRRYFRICEGDKTIIGTYNGDREENDAFVGFTEHFVSRDLPVPEVYCYMPERFIYFQRDLGDLNLYTWLHNRPDMSDFSDETKDLYKRILDNLILFQTKGIEGLDLNLCYPHKSFDRQSMMWDMNYYKYMLLKLLAVPFRERHLEHDFDTLADYLLETGQNYFLYRDFQTANIMLMGEEPWFIDYQGGRKGAPQYDVASLLNDAKIPMKQADRDEMMEYYLEKFCSVTNEDRQKFRGYYSGFSMIRLMQALGAFGFRGLYEQKPTFTETLVPAVFLLQSVAATAADHIKLPELYSAINASSNTPLFKTLEADRK
ncbi:MAG TPA: aminoglycoside phosphotransferase [Bacteroidales bacterium]|nr:aminoglycoside phosphotransferase [Bacteroidales bacterium]